MTSLFEQTILPLFEEHRGDWLAQARRAAAEMGRGGHHVTIDDVRAKVPPPTHVDPRIMGAVFTRADWEKVGFQNSIRRVSHKRPVAVFKRREVGA